ncbi:hypothetical protein [Metabacillus sp. SLBN-84]
MVDKSSFSNGLKKGLKEGLTYGSVFDKDMSERSVKETEGVGVKKLIDHISGKKKLTQEEQKNLIKLQKYTKKL